MFEHHEKSGVIPTTLVIRNKKYVRGIKRIAICGGINCDDFVDWIEIDGIKKTGDRQTFPIETAKGRLAMKKKYKFFKLRVLGNYGNRDCNGFDEFGLLGKKI